MQELALSYGQDFGSGVLPAFQDALKNAVRRGKSRFLYFFNSEAKSFRNLEDLPMAPRSMVFYFAALTGQKEFRVMPPFSFTEDDAEEMRQEFCIELLSSFNAEYHCIAFNLFENISLEAD